MTLPKYTDPVRGMTSFLSSARCHKPAQTRTVQRLPRLTIPERGFVHAISILGAIGIANILLNASVAEQILAYKAAAKESALVG